MVCAFLSTKNTVYAQERPIPVFNLNDLIDSAITNNYKLKSIILNDSLTLVEIQSIARNYQPEISGTSIFSYWDWLMPNKQRLLGENVNTDFYIQLTARQLIYDWGRNKQNKLLQESNMNINREFIRLLRQNISATVTIAYFEALKAAKKTEVLKNTRVQLNNHLEIAQNLYKIGKVSNIDLLKIQVNIQVVEKELTTAENKYTEQLANLKNIAQIKGEYGFVIEKNTDELYKEVHYMATDTLFNSLLTMHPLLKSFDEKIEKEQLEQSLYKKLNMPEVYSYALTNWESAYIPFSNNFNYNIGVGIQYTIPYWGGGSNREKIVLAKIKTDQLRNDKLEELNILKTTFDALCVQLQNTEQEINHNRTIIKIAEETLNNIIVLYQSGQENILNLLDAQTTVTQQRIAYEQSVIDYLELSARIHFLTGSDNYPF